MVVDWAKAMAGMTNSKNATIRSIFMASVPRQYKGVVAV
jgi:hypothetical protein